MERRIALGEHGPHLWTRETARNIRVEFDPILEGLEEGGALVIDTKGVEVFDYSFANELFGRTILSIPREYPGRFVLVENLSKYARENLTKALEGMGLAMMERKGKAIGLIGKVHPTDQQTFAAVAKAGRSLTSSELAEKLEVNLNAMNERLSKLLGLGLIRRERATSPSGREQYEYSTFQ